MHIDTTSSFTQNSQQKHTLALSCCVNLTTLPLQPRRFLADAGLIAII